MRQTLETRVARLLEQKLGPIFALLETTVSIRIQATLVLVLAGLWWLDVFVHPLSERMSQLVGMFWMGLSVLGPFCDLALGVILLISHVRSGQAKKLWVYPALALVALQWLLILSR